MEITDRVKSLADNYLKENNIEIVDIIYRREQPGMVLRLLVDTPGGITLEACERLNNYLSEELDKTDIINEHYTIEVSSPGLDRPLTSDRDFERGMGRMIEATTSAAVDSRKTHAGKLIGMDAGNIIIESGGISTVIPRSLITSARFKLEF